MGSKKNQRPELSPSKKKALEILDECIYPFDETRNKKVDNVLLEFVEASNSLKAAFKVKISNL